MSDQPLDLDALTALLDAATPGPWEVHDHVIVETTWGDLHLDVAGTSFSDTDTHSMQDRANAALIAALRNAAPALIAAAREREEAAGLRGEVKCTNCEADDLGCTACGAHGTLIGRSPKTLAAFNREHEWRRDAEAERDAARAEVKALTAALNIESTNYMNEVARADRAVADLDAARAVAKVCDCWKRDTRAALDADPTP